jgi:hypothetical protein
MFEERYLKTTNRHGPSMKRCCTYLLLLIFPGPAFSAVHMDAWRPFQILDGASWLFSSPRNLRNANDTLLESACGGQRQPPLAVTDMNVFMESYGSTDDVAWNNDRQITAAATHEHTTILDTGRVEIRVGAGLTPDSAIGSSLVLPAAFASIIDTAVNSPICFTEPGNKYSPTSY